MNYKVLTYNPMCTMMCMEMTTPIPRMIHGL